MENSRETRNAPKFVTPKQILRTSGNVTRQNEVSSLFLSNDYSEGKAEVILDYGRCEGGFPIFTIESASAPEGQKHVARWPVLLILQRDGQLPSLPAPRHRHQRYSNCEASIHSSIAEVSKDNLTRLHHEHHVLPSWLPSSAP
ncbi:hypothetical protein LB505_009380 [Fusarium chuoi]|nr:hypothetical protein LB505_009380 [Fusarium chuoi]